MSCAEETESNALESGLRDNSVSDRFNGQLATENRDSVGAAICYIHCTRLKEDVIETLRHPEIGVRVTSSAMFFSFWDDVIDLTR